jgi:hypothetical protein
MRCQALPLAVVCAAAIIALQAQTHAFGQAETPPQSTVRGENFSAKPAPALFASDCTGAGCHKGPQGLARRPALASFLREHYTNSRESAAALASYLASIPAAVERGNRPTPPGRVRAGPSDDEPPGTPTTARGRRSAEPAESTVPARGQRGQRGRQATVGPSEPAEPPEAPAAPAAAAASPTPPAQVFDIFD